MVLKCVQESVDRHEGEIPDMMRRLGDGPDSLKRSTNANVRFTSRSWKEFVGNPRRLDLDHPQKRRAKTVRIG